MASDDQLITQLASEISAYAPQELIDKSKGKIGIINKPRPRKFFLAIDLQENYIKSIHSPELGKSVIKASTITCSPTKSYSEHDLYPILMDFLHKDRNLKCLRINEKNLKIVLVVVVIDGYTQILLLLNH